jgi:hypothetical protein
MVPIRVPVIQGNHRAPNHLLKEPDRTIAATLEGSLDLQSLPVSLNRRDMREEVSPHIYASASLLLQPGTFNGIVALGVKRCLK